jgi:hypothetical protein
MPIYGAPTTHHDAHPDALSSFGNGRVLLRRPEGIGPFLSGPPTSDTFPWECATRIDAAPEKPAASADFVRCYRNGGDGLGSMVVYDHPCQPTGEPNDYEISKMAIHR